MAIINGLEYHIYKLLPPSNWFGKGDETVNIRDYYDNINAPFNLDIDTHKAKGVMIFNEDEGTKDAGHSFFVIKGTLKEAETLKDEFKADVESYLKNFSRNGEYKLNFEFMK